ncbi:MOSC domain-containing protein [Solemya velesiana gill symbiont]|uniref:MOSC domain-containing protein n=1 Tax=Solemya velesiana gill symbiont TaxID=1918948 RepID=UPI001FE5B072|nr:MOSC domain-containing protein [Solemya velesiana gill symbiont]
MRGISLSGIHFYPVKSCAGIALQSAPVAARGISCDRRWMVVDSKGWFLTQREYPQMALIQVALIPGGIRLQAPGMQVLDVAKVADVGEMVTVQVWGDSCTARLVDEQAADWLSEYLGCDARLVYLPDGNSRQVDLDYAREGGEVGFADGFPFLLISQASLDDLNGRLEESLPMNRFRPNLVVSGCAPYEEDSWRLIRIGDISFRVAKPCSRCFITTNDQSTAERGAEPLRTLNTYRRRGNFVYFGQNLVHDGTGELKVGMGVEVLERDGD